MDEADFQPIRSVYVHSNNLQKHSHHVGIKYKRNKNNYSKIPLMYVYVRRVNFATTKPRFQIILMRSATKTNFQGSTVEKNTQVQRMQMRRILPTKRAITQGLTITTYSDLGSCHQHETSGARFSVFISWGNHRWCTRRCVFSQAIPGDL